MENGEEQALRKAFEVNNWGGWEENELLFKCITHRQKDNMHLYDYGAAVLVERNHPVLMKCRGLVVDDNGKVLNYPFERFFNDWEKEKAEIDWDSAEAQEKIDGSLVCVFWNGKAWETTTRGSFYPYEHKQEDGEEWFSEEWFLEQFNKFHLLEKDCCYMFELVTKHNWIVTRYTEEFVTLIGARYLAGGFKFREFQQGLLGLVADELGVERPRMYRADNIEGCKALFSKLRDDEEGLVIVDTAGNRIKLKQESYLKLVKIKMLNKRELFEHIAGRLDIDREFLEKLPEVKEEINTMKKKWENHKNTIWATYEDIKQLAHKSRKEFAMEANEHDFKAFLFALLDGKMLDDAAKWGMVERLFE